MVSLMENPAVRAELLTDSAELRREVDLAVRTLVIDVYTHLFPPEFGGLFLYRIDELLIYHYLIAETFPFDGSVTRAFLGDDN
jgi:hypothetical protein